MDIRLLKTLFQVQWLFSVVAEGMDAFDEPKRNGKEVLVDFSKELSNNSPTRTEEKHDK
jgi:hypothetical protein